MQGAAGYNEWHGATPPPTLAASFLGLQWPSLSERPVAPKTPSLYARLCSKCCKYKDESPVPIPKQLIDNEETNAAAEIGTGNQGNQELQREETESALRLGRARKEEMTLGWVFRDVEASHAAVNVTWAGLHRHPATVCARIIIL